MSKTVIIVILGAVIIYGITNLVINENIYEMSEKSIDIYSQTKARNIGNSAAEILKVKVAEDNNFRVNSAQTINLDEGTATYRVVDTTFDGETLVKFDISANYLDSYKHIEAFVKIESSLPSLMNKGVMGEKEVTFNGDYLSVKDTNNPTINADVHSNMGVKLNGSNYFFEGFITSAGTIDNDGSNIQIIPNSNPQGAPVSQQNVAPVAIPNFVAGNYLSKANQTYDSDQTFSGNIILGTKSSPKIIYVKGKVIMNNTNITGYGIIVAENDIEIYGNVSINSANQTASQFGMFTSGKLMINNANKTVEATIISQSETILNNQDINVIGSITSKDKVTFNGLRGRLFYKPADESIISPFFEIEYKRPKFAHWYE